MAKMNIKSGDKVRIIAGKDKGAEGEVLRTLPAQQRVVVQEVNLVKKALRPTQVNPQGGIEEREAPIHVSNVQLICPSCNIPTRVGVRREDGKKVRTCKKCGKDID